MPIPSSQWLPCDAVLMIAQDAGVRATESYLAFNLARLEAVHGDRATALDQLRLAIGNCHRAGNTTGMRSPLSVLAGVLHQLGRHQPAATIIGYAFNPLTAAAFPELNAVIAELRGVLGEQTYESLARKGETMTAAAVVSFAYDQIDSARTKLESGQARNLKPAGGSARSRARLHRRTAPARAWRSGRSWYRRAACCVARAEGRHCR